MQRSSLFKHSTLLLIVVVFLSSISPSAGAVERFASEGPLAIPRSDPLVYSEDFSSYSYKDSADNVDWNIWGQSLTVSRLDGAASWQGQVAGDGDGNAFVVWTTYRDGYYTLFAQKLDAYGNKLWPTDVPVAFVGTDVLFQCVTVAVDPDGNAYVAYSSDNLYLQKVDTDGTLLWPVDKIVRYGETGGCSITGDPAGGVVVSWVNGWAGTLPSLDIYAQRIDSSGQKRWASDVKVNGTATQNSNPGLSVATDSQSRTIVTWTARGSSGPLIGAQYLSGNGDKRWGADAQVNADAMPNGLLGNVVLADDGTATVVWQDSRTSNSAVYVQRIRGDGARIHTHDLRADTMPDGISAWYPVAAAAPAGMTYVTWIDARSGKRAVYAQALDAAANRQWDSDAKVSAESAILDNPPAHPHLTVTADGNPLFIWRDVRDRIGTSLYDDSKFFSQKLGPTGERLWTSDVRVNWQTGRTDQKAASVAQDSSGNLVVVWNDNRRNDPDILATRISPDGTRQWQADLRVNSDLSGAFQSNPVVAIDSNRNAIVAWEDTREGGKAIYLQKLDRNGNKQWAGDVRVSADWVSSRQTVPEIAVDGSGATAVAWYDMDSDIYYAQLLDSNGSRLWPHDLVLSAVRSFDGYRPALDFDSSGMLIVSFATNGVYVQAISQEGSKQWGDGIKVSSRVAPSGVASISAGRVYVAWILTSGVFAQVLDAAGNPTWSAPLQVSHADAYPINTIPPAVDVDPSGNAIVAWLDYRTTSHVMAQKVSATGQRLWLPSDVQISSDAAFGSGPLDIAAGSSAVVYVWDDERNSNTDIYAQRTNLAGARSWLVDLPVISQERFYFPNGTVQSRRVSDGVVAIRRAKLSADYELQGGGIEWSLSNDGGTNWIDVTPGVIHAFATLGTDLRWRAVLSTDLLWPRTPQVNALSIEYWSDEQAVDNYENDDTCNQARPIAVNGAAQTRSFHQAGDADWVWFEVITGTTYVVQTSRPEERADTKLEFRKECPEPPLGSDDNAFGREARITWKANFTGRVYVKVANQDPAIYGVDTGYDLSVRVFSQSPVAIIVAGHNDGYTLQSNINSAADAAYRTFLGSGIPKANLRYFAPGGDRDVDGNGANDDITGPPQPAAVKEAVQDWSRSRGVGLGVPFFLVLVDHGEPDRFLADGTSGKISASEVDLWLSNLEATSGADNVNVIIEACHSGSFIDTTEQGPARISGRQRVVIASTASGLNAYASPEGAHFSDVFWTSLGQNKDLRTAFLTAREAVRLTGLNQVPWLDDNGDATADSLDGGLARSRGLGLNAPVSPPVVDWVQTTPQGPGAALLKAQVRDDTGVSQVWAMIYPPDFQEPPPTQDGTTPVLNVPTVSFGGAGDDLFNAPYGQFTQTGDYRIVVYGQDQAGNKSVPMTIFLTGPITVERLIYLPIVLR